MILYTALLFMTVMGSIASLFLKKASGGDGILSLLKNVNLYIGILLYVGSAVLNIILLRYLDYSVVLPLTSLTYIWTIVISSLVLKEKITIPKIGGAILIVTGAILVSI